MTTQESNHDAIMELAKECGFKFGLRKITCDEAAIINLVSRIRWISDMMEKLPASSSGSELSQ